MLSKNVISNSCTASTAALIQTVTLLRTVTLFRTVALLQSDRTPTQMVAGFRSDATIPNSSQRSRHEQVYYSRKTDSVRFRVRRSVRLPRSAQGFGLDHVLETAWSRSAYRPSPQRSSSQLTRSTQLPMVNSARGGQLSSQRSRHEQVYCSKKTDSIQFRVRRSVRLPRLAQAFGLDHVLETARSRSRRRPSHQRRSSQLTRSISLRWSTQLVEMNSALCLDTTYDLKQLANRPLSI
ncbi:hypothetical protein F511_29800 [Dorcoceras hygrometricum]|uniref:Uncharacterized protein n=1 Tax=Dorcoceras hygrometricum TaxID=472368 RepID=A0A2Z7ATQ1_9LAMI|nr:hypothetical protein F511_29800 [Dorcoceras hygrometricum]